MKYIYALTLTLSLIINCRKTETIVITGSETMHPMMIILSNEFMKKNDNYDVKVIGGGSEEGIIYLNEGKTDIAAVSREVPEEELIALGDPQKLLIAYDGAAIIVHPSNQLKDITLEQVHLIFAGKIKNWKELGGDNGLILPVIRNDHSGTAKFFTEHVLRKKDISIAEYEKNKTLEFSKEFKAVKDNYAMAEFIHQNPTAVGFMGMGAVKENSLKVKTLDYSRKKGDEFITPSIENVLNRKYKLARGLYLLYQKSSEPKLGKFINFVLSEDGQKSILKSGYLRSTLTEVEVKANKP